MFNAGNVIMIEIRQGQLRDAELIIDFQIRLAKETEGLRLNRETVRKGVLAVLRDKSKGEYHIAQEKNEVLGMLLTVPEWSDWRNGTVLWIHSLYVRPEYRRKGVFKRLYQHLKTKVEQSPDLVGLRLYADKHNSAARRVYEKLEMNKDHYLLYEWLK